MMTQKATERQTRYILQAFEAFARVSGLKWEAKVNSVYAAGGFEYGVAFIRLEINTLGWIILKIQGTGKGLVKGTQKKVCKLTILFSRYQNMIRFIRT